MRESFTSQTISWFNQRNRERELELAPPFQRKPVWTDRQRALLVDTILRGLPVPEIYMQRKTSSDGESQYVIVDGQQRIRSILGFIAGEFTLSEEDNPDLADYAFDDLSDAQKTQFWDYTLKIRELHDATDSDIRDMFRRLNVNVVALNAQELRNARYLGPFIKLMTDLAELDFWSEHRIFSATQIRRMLDIESVSELFVAMMDGVQNKKKSLGKYYGLYETDFPEQRKWRLHFGRVLDTIDSAFPEFDKTRLRKKSDFYSFFVAVSQMLEGHYLPESEYEEVGTKLESFAEQVDEAADSTSMKAYDKNVVKYYKAVEKAASDKDRRADRVDCVKTLLDGHFHPRKLRRTASIRPTRRKG